MFGEALLPDYSSFSVKKRRNYCRCAKTAKDGV